MDLARSVLFTRALARVVTHHEALATPQHRRWRSLARLLGEFVSLLALAYLAEHDGIERPWDIMLGIFWAFFLPTIVLTDDAVRAARAKLGLGDGIMEDVFVGAVGVFFCFAAYEALVKLMSDMYYESRR